MLGESSRLPIYNNKAIKSGIPQGSILGQTLFNIYMVDIPKLQKAKLAFCADDTMIYNLS